MDDASKDLNARWLKAAQAGDRQARDELVRHLYPVWRRMAEECMRRERPGHTLQTGDLLHEGIQRVLKTRIFARAQHVGFLSRAMKRAMECVLKDHARRKNSAQRGGDWQRVPLDPVLDQLMAHCSSPEQCQQLLTELGVWDWPEGQALWLQLCGYTGKEIARELGVSVSSVEKKLHFMRQFVRERLQEA